MTTPSGDVVDLTSMCRGEAAPSIPTGPPVAGANPVAGYEPVGVNLAITEGQDSWVVRGLITNQTQARMDILAIQFDVLDANGTLLYTDVLVPRNTGFGPGQERTGTHLIPLDRISGQPATVVATESRYVQ